MDIGDIKKYADLMFHVSVSKKNALEKARSRQLMAYNERLFRADAETINLAHTLSQNRQEFYILDVNDNPCLIVDSQDFLEKLITRNQETLNSYHQLHKDLADKKAK